MFGIVRAAPVAHWHAHSRPPGIVGKNFVVPNASASPAACEAELKRKIANAAGRVIFIAAFFPDVSRCSEEKNPRAANRKKSS
jgi:hypothetical protein